MPDAEIALDPVEPVERLPDGADELRRQLLPRLDRQVELDLAAQVLSDHANALEDRVERERRWALDDDQYHGILPEKTFPWSGCSNFFIPLTPTGVETMKPRLIESVLGDDQPILVRPVEATDEDRQDITERFLNWQVMTQMDLAQQVAESAHRFLVPGMVIAKTLWRVEERVLRAVRSFPTDMPLPEILTRLFGSVTPEDLKKDGDGETWTGTLRGPSGATRPVSLTFKFLADETQVLLVKDEVTYEAPRVELLDIEDFIAPINGGGDLQRLPWCQHRLWLDEQALRRKVRLGLFDQDAVEDLLRGQNPSGDEGTLDSTAVRAGRAQAEGVEAAGASSVRGDEYEVLEDYRRWDLDDDGWDEEIVCWVSPQLPDRVLGWDYLDNLYAHGRRPFRVGKFLSLPGRFYGTSFPELIRTLQDEINTIHNQNVDAGTVRNTPGGFYRSSSTMTPGLKPWSPGEWIPVDNPQTDVREFQWGGNDMWGANQESTLYQMFERLTGLTDLALGRQPSRVGATRTATGVASLLSESGLRFKTAMASFQRFWRDVFSDILALDQQYLPPGVEFRVTGRLPEMIRLTSRADIAGRFDLRLATTTESLNRSVLREDATIKLQMGLNPIVLQLGHIASKGIYRLLRQFFLAYGETDPDLVLELARPDAVMHTPQQEMQIWVSGGDAEPSMAEDLMGHYQQHQVDLQDPLVRETLGPAGIQKVERHLAKTTQLIQMQAAIQQMTQRGGKGETGGAPPAGEQAKNAQIGRQAGMLGPQEPAGFGGGQNGMAPGGPGGMG